MNILLDELGGTLSVTRKTSGTLITAAGFNTNYSEIEAVINGAIEAGNIAADAVTAVKINSDVVRSGYGLVQHTDGSLYVDVSDTNPCLEISDGGVRAKVDDSSIERASGGLQVKAVGVTNAMLAGSIEDSKLNQITTASKVSIAALAETLTVARGGTGATTAAGAHTNIVVARSYNSGFFAISAGSEYTKTHSLNLTVPTNVLIIVIGAIDASGTSARTLHSGFGAIGSTGYGVSIQGFDTNSFVVQIGGSGTGGLDDNGTAVANSYTYVKILAIALE